MFAHKKIPTNLFWYIHTYIHTIWLMISLPCLTVKWTLTFIVKLSEKSNHRVHNVTFETTFFFDTYCKLQCIIYTNRRTHIYTNIEFFGKKKKNKIKEEKRTTTRNCNKSLNCITLFKCFHRKRWYFFNICSHCCNMLQKILVYCKREKWTIHMRKWS